MFLEVVAGLRSGLNGFYIIDRRHNDFDQIKAIEIKKGKYENYAIPS